MSSVVGRLSRRTIGLGLAIAVLTSCLSVTSGYAIGAQDDGTTKELRVRSELRLTLLADRDWTLESTDTQALHLKSSQLGSIGGQSYRVWLFDVTRAGDFVIRATGQAACTRNAPPCADAPLRYTFKLHAT
jgi:hypothetical protein